MASDFHSQIKGMFQLLFVGIYSVAQDKKCGFAVVFVQGIYKFVRISSGTVVKGKGNILCLFYRYLASGNLVGVFGFNFDICSTVFLSFYFTVFYCGNFIISTAPRNRFIGVFSLFAIFYDRFDSCLLYTSDAADE